MEALLRGCWEYHADQGSTYGAEASHYYPPVTDPRPVHKHHAQKALRPCSHFEDGGCSTISALLPTASHGVGDRHYMPETFDSLVPENLWYGDSLIAGGAPSSQELGLLPGGSLLPWATSKALAGQHLSEGIMLPHRHKPSPYTRGNLDGDMLTPRHSLNMHKDTLGPIHSPESSSDMDQDQILSQALVKPSGQQFSAGCDEIDKQREKNRWAS